MDDGLKTSASVRIYCSRGGHPRTKVARFNRVEIPEREGLAGRIVPARRVWTVRHLARPEYGFLNDALERETTQGRQSKMTARCRFCDLDLQRNREAFEAALDRLADNNVRSIELANLAAILT